MRLQYAVSSLAVLACVASLPAQAASDPFFPTFGNAGIDVQHYDLALTVDPVPAHIAGKATLLVKATANLTSFSLDLHALTVSSVKVNLKTASFNQSNDKLTITPTKSIKSGSVFAVEIAYSGNSDPIADPTAPDGSGVVLGWLTYGKSAYVVSEPVGASTFFPVNDDLKDKATYTFRVTVPEPYKAATNGRLLNVKDLGSKRRYTFEMLQPMASWLATVQVNQFKVVEAKASGGIKVRTYATSDTTNEAIAGFQAAKDMIPYLAARFGPYPFETYSSVAIDDPTLGYALETQSISVFPKDVFSSDFVSHELAHQWFGDSVSVKQWKDLWLAEGFATYVEVLWPNRADKAGYDKAMLAIYNDVKKNAVGPAVVDKPEDLFSDRTYNRGVMVLYALEKKIGQPMLFKVMRTWATENRYHKVTTADFVDTVVRVTRNKSLRDFLNHWIYDATVPTLPGTSASAIAKAASGASLPTLVESHRR
ncbi:M1 family metallopeptidase [Oryzibacter oryziterrae]|uniref:M1 family metallopeptidase n=1 Tax=Oryzibacter oryziterrae TaxID=2766474 RepID=UPI001F43D063|nr:M1 family metallopeptidase [Oryzibacter oryziterrae]